MHPNALIIHFTDGHSNLGILPEDVFPILRDAFPYCQVLNVTYSSDPSGIDAKGTSIAGWKEYRNNLPNNEMVELHDIKDFGVLLRKLLRK